MQSNLSASQNNIIAKSRKIGFTNKDMDSKSANYLVSTEMSMHLMSLLSSSVLFRRFLAGHTFMEYASASITASGRPSGTATTRIVMPMMMKLTKSCT